MSSDQTTRLANVLKFRSEVSVGLESTFFSIINSVTLVGNIFVCCAIWRNNRLRQNVSNMFIFALALSDIFMALCMPSSVVTLVTGRWSLGAAFCQIQGFLILTLAMVSLQTMALISINRYYCIVKRAKYLLLFKKRRTRSYIMSLWLNALIASIPPFLLNVGGYAFQPGKSICLYTFEANIPYTIFLEAVYIALPLTIITRCYSAVFKEVYRTNKVFIQTPENANRVRANVQEAKITKTLAAVILAFGMCWVPISIVDIIDAAKGQPYLQREIYLTYTALIFTSSLVNPFIYGIFNRTFLYEYKKMLRQLLCCRLLVCYPSTAPSVISDFVSSPNEKPNTKRQINSGDTAGTSPGQDIGHSLNKDHLISH